MPTLITTHCSATHKQTKRHRHGRKSHLHNTSPLLSSPLSPPLPFLSHHPSSAPPPSPSQQSDATAPFHLCSSSVGLYLSLLHRLVPLCDLVLHKTLAFAWVLGFRNNKQHLYNESDLFPPAWPSYASLVNWFSPHPFFKWRLMMARIRVTMALEVQVAVLPNLLYVHSHFES